MYPFSNPLGDYVDFLGNPLQAVFKGLGYVLQPFTIYCSFLFLISFEIVLLFRLLHPNLTLFLKVFRVIIRYKYLFFIPHALNIIAFAYEGSQAGVLFYAYNCTIVGIYSFMASRLVVRSRPSPVWFNASLPSQYQERGGGFIARNQFFIAVSKHEYLAELALVATGFNLCLVYWVENEPFFATLVIITDIYIAAFLSCNLITNIPVRHGEGTCVAPGIMMFARGITREYISILKLQAVDANVENDNREEDRKIASDEAFMSFFKHQWYFILARIRTFVSLNVLTSDSSYDAYLVIRKRTVVVPPRTSIALVNAAITQITTSINTTLTCHLEVLSPGRIAEVIDKMKFDAPAPHRIEASFLARLSEPALADTMFRFQEGFVTFLNLGIEKHVRTHPTQRINETTRLDSLIKALIAERIVARYMFSIKLESIEKMDLKEYLGEDRIVTTKVRHGFMEIERNFEYLINGARVTAGIFVFSNTREEQADAVERARGIIHSTWEAEVRIERNPVTAAMHLACNGTESLLYHVPCYLLYRFFHLPRVPSGKQERRHQNPLDPPPDTVIAGGVLNIGRILDPGGGKRDFLLDISDLRRHVFINGTTGSGKTVFTHNLVDELIQHYPSLPFLLLELKGEYASLRREHPNVVFLEPGINFSINMFDPVVDVHVHAERIFNILKTSFDFADMKDFSPQMERVLVDLITMTCKTPERSRRGFATFFENAREYVNSNKARIPYLDSTWIGIENRLRRVTTGALRNVFDGQPRGSGQHASILGSRAVISLASIINLGGTKDDLYFVANMILKMVWDENITRGPSNDIGHVTIVDDVQYFSRTRGNFSARETNFLEDIALLLRGTGEALIAISTRPDISEDVLSNCGLIVCFQTKFKEDVQKLTGLLHLPEEKASTLEILPEHTSIIKLNSYPYPFMLETRRPHFAGFKPTTAEPAREHILVDAERRDFTFLSRFYARVRDYYQLRDRAWEQFPSLSMTEVEAIQKETRDIHEDIEAMIRDHDEIRKLVRTARTTRPSDERLARIHDEFLV